MIHGYPASASVTAGQTLTLHVSTDTPRFRVCFYRFADALIPVMRSSWLKGELVAPAGADEDWCWPAYHFTIPAAWQSAVYIAHLEEPGGEPVSLALTSAAALFVVRTSPQNLAGFIAGRRMLYKIPLATYHAYNYSGEGCYYANPPVSRRPSHPGASLSLQRPGGGIGGPVWGAPDYYDSGSSRQTFAHWDARFIAWLVRRGYTAEFCTDIDLHNDPALCQDFRLLLSVGHDEYWSEPMRDAVEAFVGAGGNVAFFCANLCWWRIHLLDECKTMVCHQGGPQGARDHWWPASGANRPEELLSGVSYRHGGGWWDGPRHTRGYLVQRPEHWLFDGTGLKHGDAFGANTWPPLIGYECDGALLDGTAATDPPRATTARNDMASVVAALHGVSTQPGRTEQDEQHEPHDPPGQIQAPCPARPKLEILAMCPLDQRWQELPAREGMAAGEGQHAATMGIMQSKNHGGGIVFTAGTTDWAQVLASGQEPAVDIITANVLRHLLASPEDETGAEMAGPEHEIAHAFPAAGQETANKLATRRHEPASELTAPQHQTAQDPARSAHTTASEAEERNASTSTRSTIQRSSDAAGVPSV